MKLRRTTVVLLLAVILNIISGCSGNTSERLKDKSFSLYVGNVSDSLPSTYMPWLSNQGISPIISSSIYNTLFSYDEEKGEYTPGIGERWEYIVQPEDVTEDQDYIEVKVILNKDAKWSDGMPVTSKDIYFTFDLAADYGRTNHAGALAWVGDLLHTYSRGSDGKYTLTRQGVFYKDNPGPYKFGAEETNVVYFRVKKVLGAITPMFTTVLILPEHKWNVLSTKNQLNTTNPVPHIKKLYDNPIGSGPYTLDVEKSNSSIIVLNKRSAYHLKDDKGEDLFKPEVIKFLNYMDMNVAINALKEGDIDIINTGIDAAFVDNLSKTKNVKVDFAEGSFIETLVLNLNVPKEYSTPERETLKIPEVREAISLAIDQRSLIEKVLRGSGKPVPSGLISESSILYNPEVGIGQPEIEKANKLLDASGFLLKSGEKIRSRDNVKLSYKISGNQGNKNLINYIKVQLEKIGIEVMFEEGGSNAVKDRYYTGNFDMTIQGVIFNMANVDMMMVAHFVTVGSSSNYGRLNDPVLKSIVQEMRTTLSEKNKIEKLKEIQKYIADLNYKIPLYCPDIISVYRTDIYDGWTTEKGTNIYNNETLSNLKFKNY